MVTLEQLAQYSLISSASLCFHTAWVITGPSASAPGRSAVGGRAEAEWRDFLFMSPHDLKQNRRCVHVAEQADQGEDGLVRRAGGMGHVRRMMDQRAGRPRRPGFMAAPPFANSRHQITEPPAHLPVTSAYGSFPVMQRALSTSPLIAKNGHSSCPHPRVVCIKVRDFALA